MDLTADTGLTVVTYSAEPGKEVQRLLRSAPSWTATLHPQDAAQSLAATEHHHDA